MYIEQVSGASCGVLAGLVLAAVVCSGQRVQNQPSPYSVFRNFRFLGPTRTRRENCSGVVVQLRTLLWSGSGNVIFGIQCQTRKHAVSSSTFPAEFWL